MESGDILLESADWKYLGEGKVHLVCCYDGTTSELPPNEPLKIISSQSDCGSCLDEESSGEATADKRDITRDKDRTDTITSVLSDSLVSQLDTNFDRKVIAEGIIRREKEKERNCSTSYRNRVIRLSKKYQSKENILHDELYLNNIIKPWFGTAFSSNRTLIELSSVFLKGLNERTRTSRPKGRIHVPFDVSARYGILENNVCSLGRLMPALLMEKNLLGGESEVVTFKEIQSNPTVCVEIKTKCNVPSRSPYVHPDNRIKYGEGRFTLMQLYKTGKMENTCNNSSYCTIEDNIVQACNDFQECNERSRDGQCEWGEFKEMSDYDPTDILSGCTLRIHTALEALYKNPQNNFKLFIDGDCIYGGSKSTLNDKKISELKLEKFFLREKEKNLTPYKQEEKNGKLKGNNISNENAAVDLDSSGVTDIFEVLTSILKSESILKKIRIMQFFDFLDIEGANFVFEKLIALRGGIDKAEEKLKEGIILPFEKPFYEFCEMLERNEETEESDGKKDTDEEKRHQNCSDEGNNSENYHCTNSYNAYQPKNRYESLLLKLKSLQINQNMTENEMNNQIILAHQFIETLTESDCIFLLKLFLCSLSARDCSVMISMKRVQICKESPLPPLSPSSPSFSVPLSHQNVSPSSFSSSSSSSSPRFFPPTPPSLPNSPTSLWHTICIQSDSMAGIVVKNNIQYKPHNNDSDTYNNSFIDDNGFIAYSVGIVDIGIKPISKIKSKMEKENEIISMAKIGLEVRERRTDRKLIGSII